MLKTAVVGLVIVFVCITAAFPENPEKAPVTPYLGISSPYPESVPDLKIPLKDHLAKDRSVLISLAVDKKGKVKQVEYPPDAAAIIEVILKDLKKIKFEFIEGRQLDFPLAVPVEVTFVSSERTQSEVRLKFPLSPEIIADPALLADFFQRNGVQPPGIVALQPIYYRIDGSGSGPDYRTVTARVFLDEKGELQDLAFPIPDQSDGSHPVHMAIMNARFEPLKIKSQPAPCDFLLTFRIFSNLKYPISPLQRTDSTEAQPYTARYFMTQYYNADDISVPALPRNHGAGLIQAANIGLGRAGIAELSVKIDTSGNIAWVKVRTISPGLGNRPEQAIRLVNWYPARDRHGTARSFAGKISISFDGSTQIVYIPEWLKL